MKRTSRVLAILLALAMLLSVTAFATETAASWSVFGGNADHNAVVGKAPTTDVTVTALKLLKPDSGWDGVDTVPLMQTVGNVTYAYALGGMAICNGYAVFGNDYNHLYIVK